MSTKTKTTRMPARPGPVPLGHPNHPKTRKPEPASAAPKPAVPAKANKE